MRNNKHQVICILGMHRSGTSMVARILNICGLYIGTGKDLMPGGFGNELGHWEAKEVHDINEEILKRLGGAWDDVPNLSSKWMDYKKFSDLKKRARLFIEKMNLLSGGVWGFKDPRTCITLPFWKQLIPEMIYVIPARNFINIANSLKKRDNITNKKGIILCIKYWLSIIKNTADEKKIITFYINYFDNWEDELTMILNFINSNKINYKRREKNIKNFINPTMNHCTTKGAYITKVNRDDLMSFFLEQLADSIDRV